jgi:hypothetical protein
MSCPAKLMARQGVFTGPLKLERALANHPGHSLDSELSSANREQMNRISAGDSDVHWNLRWHDHAAGNKHELLRDHA